MQTTICTTAAVAALGLAVSILPAAAQHHGGPSGGNMGGAPSMGHAMGAAPSMGAAPRSNFSAPSTSGMASGPGNFGPNRANVVGPRGVATPNNGMAWSNWGRRGDRFHDFGRRRHFGPGFAFGFGAPYYGDDYYAYDYGPDYAYDYGYDYGNSCFAVRRVFRGGYWHLRRVWICG